MFLFGINIKTDLFADDAEKDCIGERDIRD